MNAIPNLRDAPPVGALQVAHEGADLNRWVVFIL